MQAIGPEFEVIGVIFGQTIAKLINSKHLHNFGKKHTKDETPILVFSSKRLRIFFPNATYEKNKMRKQIEISEFFSP